MKAGLVKENNIIIQAALTKTFALKQIRTV